MKYLYYPGCSLTGTAREYDLSTRAFMKKAGVELIEIPDWTCCGASAAESVSELLSLALAARVMALAEEESRDLDILVPCSACYLNLKKVEDKVLSDARLHEKVNIALSEDGLTYHGGVLARHLLDILSRDLGAKQMESMTVNPWEGRVIAPYYGCQCLRPYGNFDDPERPVSMNTLLKAAGAEVLPWELGGKCCGASLINTHPDEAIRLVAALLLDARDADAIVTVCPMCQMNLEAFQERASRIKGRNLKKTILYLPQFLGIAAGLSPGDVGLEDNLSITSGFRVPVKKSFLEKEIP